MKGALQSASLIISAVAATLFAVPVTAEAAVLSFEATLLGSNEVPPSGSSGTGFAIVTIDPATNQLTVNVTFSGLTLGPAPFGTTASHIHCCAPPGMNAIVATTTPTFPGFPLNVESGSYSMSFDMTMASSYNPAFITANGGTPASAESVLFTGIETGNAYLNIHTTTDPGGEIRGWLTPVPLPTALPLFATGLGALGLLGWRRKRKV